MWRGGNEDGGAGNLGTVVRAEEDSNAVFVQWDRRAAGDVHRYAWPRELAQHEVAHAQFTEIAADVQQVQEQTGLSSVAVTELLRRAGRFGATATPRPS